MLNKQSSCRWFDTPRRPYNTTKTKTGWFNSLRPSRVIWRHISGSTLAHVMACCLTATSHYLHHCWVLIGEVVWYLPLNNFTAGAQATIFTNYTLEALPHLSVANKFKLLLIPRMAWSLWWQFSVSFWKGGQGTCKATWQAVDGKNPRQRCGLDTRWPYVGTTVPASSQCRTNVQCPGSFLIFAVMTFPIEYSRELS